ncbi:MAG TPA: Cd(II)/Pb(II)-responsive transcriptional regulator [Burkholderiaceae bacterium]|nr:Cd(II)/Pb(II)-responsive transcriptional regulator [Burkholderiaceae bacterium]
MKIGELARSAETPVETIRYYEREGLLPKVERSQGNYRIYRPADAARLSFIRSCRNLDMTLDEIRLLLRFRDAPGENCAGVNELLDEHIEHVAARIRELRQLQRQLQALRQQCEDAGQAVHCGILNSLDERGRDPDRTGTAAPRHVGGAHARRP